MIEGLPDILIAPSAGAMIVGAFATAIITLIAYELSKKEWITLTVALISSIACILLGYMPAWVIAVVVIVFMIWLAYDVEHGKW